MKKILSLLFIALISVMMMPDMAAQSKKKVASKARTTATTSAIKWIGGEIPSPSAVCKAWIDNSGTAAFEKTLRSKGYSYAGGMWDKDMIATFKIEGGRADIVIGVYTPSADLYNEYLKAAKAFVKGKSAYDVYEDDGWIYISKMF